MTKTVSDIRTGFLDFFKRNGHEVRPSGSLVPHNDPTLMFANAGMNQFKNVFTGAEKLPFVRAATSQKCVRAGGKHNDLDNVGYTARHHTFFEMLGNFSFGDYFKDGAIEFAWNLLTKDYGLDKNKLYVTVYHTDDEAFGIWKKVTGFPDSKIIRIDTNDNFWSMGDTGPCGPCSEIFYDHGNKIPGGLPGTPDADGDRFIEIWNLVFMQYEQLASGERINLPKPSIDTGMGLERISAVLQGVHDNYDIDLFKTLINSSKSFSGNKEHETSHRVIADHLRSSCFLMADGVLPSNEGRGYVLRRIMRRAMRHAHLLGCKDPLMYKLVPSLIGEMGAQYPELNRAEALITENLRAEEERFKETLARGLKLLEDEVEKILPLPNPPPQAGEGTKNSLSTSVGRAGEGKILSGEIAFKLYDTYGFPLDLTQDILRASGLEVDTDGFEKAMEGQREMARAAHKGSGDVATGKIWFELKEKLGAGKFLGYEQEAAEGKVLAIVKDGAEVASANAGDKVYIILDQTPFYGESGGQVGDIGEFSGVATVTNTSKPLEDFIVHEAALQKALKVGDTVSAKINVANRDAIRLNHSATHLLHKALRDVLGEHVTQKGSLVNAEHLRFDISNNKAVSREEIAEVEKRVNEVIARGGAVECKEMSPDDAIKAGAMALFGEKYGDKVRVLGIGKTAAGGNYSVELCGGTHARNVADIGLLKVTSEGSVAAGIRRLEAVTGSNVVTYMNAELAKLYEQVSKLEQDGAKIAAELKTAAAKPSEKPQNIVSIKDASTIYNKETARLDAAITDLQEQNKKLNRQLAEAKKQAALGDSAATVEKVGSYDFIAKNFDGLDPKELRGVAEGYMKQAQIVVVSTVVEGKVSLVVSVEKTLSAKISAVTLTQAAVAELGGKGGGGKPEMAQGGGTDASRIQQAIEKIKSMIG